jgi:hypothetical protein
VAIGNALQVVLVDQDALLDRRRGEQARSECELGENRDSESDACGAIIACPLK